MLELQETDSATTTSSAETAPGPLTGLRAVDLSAGRGAYAARLLADLGVHVTRVHWSNDPLSAPSIPGFDATWTFNNLSKTILELDGDAGSTRVHSLLSAADVVITDATPAQLRQRGLEDLTSRYPRLVHLSVSPWGLDGPRADQPASDLTLLAAGGLLRLAGERDQPPVRAAGEQSSVAASLHGVVGTLIALLARDGVAAGSGSGSGQLVDVSTQEAVAHSLENAAQYVDLEGVVRHRTGSQASEAGSGLFRCQDGYVYLVTGIGGVPLAWDGLIAWMRGSGAPHAAEELIAPRWQDRDWRRTAEATAAFRTLFEEYASGRTKAELCEGGQANGVSISPVSTAADLLTNEQLAARQFFRSLALPDGHEITVPGPPYRFDNAQLGPYPPRYDDYDLGGNRDRPGRAVT